MKTPLRTALLFVILGIFTASAGLSEDGQSPQDELFRQADEVDLKDFLWKKRPIVVFADSPNDPAFIEQIDLINARRDALLERDVVVLTDTDPETLSPMRRKLRPRGFMLVLLSKEGRVQLRKPFPWDVREISRSIDKMPIRQQELRDAKHLGG